MENDECNEHIVIEAHGSIKLIINQSSYTILIFDGVGELSIDIVN